MVCLRVRTVLLYENVPGMFNFPNHCNFGPETVFTKMTLRWEMFVDIMYSRTLSNILKLIVGFKMLTITLTNKTQQLCLVEFDVAV